MLAQYQFGLVFIHNNTAFFAKIKPPPGPECVIINETFVIK